MNKNFTSICSPVPVAPPATALHPTTKSSLKLKSKVSNIIDVSPDQAFQYLSPRFNRVNQISLESPHINFMAFILENCCIGQVVDSGRTPVSRSSPSPPLGGAAGLPEPPVISLSTPLPITTLPVNLHETHLSIQYHVMSIYFLLRCLTWQPLHL